MDNANTPAAREMNTGRYAPSVERPCKCGHGLGAHSAERVKVDGVMYQPCFACEEEGGDCECFSKARKVRK